MERTGCMDDGAETKKIYAVVVWKMRLSWWCVSHGERGVM